MLQIATGKFFTKPELVLEHSGTGILYSNFALPVEIETSAATLVPVDWLGAGPRAWVVRYTNRLESVFGGP